MEHISILLVGVSFTVYKSYKIPRPHGTYTHTSIRGFHSGFTGVIKCGHANKVKNIEKMEMAETSEVRRGFTLLTDFSENSS